MKRLARSVVLRLLTVLMLLSLAGCESVQFEFSPSRSLPAPKTTPFALTAGLVLPESVSTAVFKDSYRCLLGKTERSIPLGKEFERQMIETFSHVFKTVEVVSDKSTAAGRYDVLVEVDLPSVDINGLCWLKILTGLTGVLLPLLPSLPSSVVENVTVTGKMTDSSGRAVLAQEMVTQSSATACQARSEHDGEAAYFQYLLANRLCNLAERFALTPKVVQYARSFSGSPEERRMTRLKGQELRIAQAPQREPDVNINEVPTFSARPRDNDVAVVIGIEQYQQKLPKSDYSSRDAALVKAYLSALGFRERNIELLVNEQATQSSIRKTVETWLPNRVKPDSRVVVYYSGHGAPDPQSGEAYLVPYDGDPNYLPDTGYPLKRLYEALGKAKAKEVIVLLDSCFSGAGGRSVLAKGARPMVLVQEGARLPPNLAVLSSSQGAQISTSFSEKGHGLFTYYFVKALKEGKKTLTDIYTAIKPEVEDEAKRQNIQQTPSLLPSPELLRGQFALRD